MIIVTIFGLIAFVALLVLAWRAEKKPSYKILQSTLSVFVVSAIVVPYVNDTLARRRDREAREFTARMNHRNELRPALDVDIKNLKEIVDLLTAQGHVVDINRSNRDDSEPILIVGDDLRREEDARWTPHVLTPDLAAHFPEFGGARERLRQQAIQQDISVRELIRRVQSELKMPRPSQIAPPRERHEQLIAARAVIRQCMGRGNGIMVQRRGDPKLGSPTYYAYSDSLGGKTQVQADSNGQARFSDLGPERLASLAGYQSANLDQTTKDACRALGQAANQMAAEAARLSKVAADVRDEVKLTGNCRYLDPEAFRRR